MPKNFKWPITDLNFDKVSSLTQSQAGQDLFVIAVTQGKKKGRWLELGSGHEKLGNNTWLLEKEFSWTGDSIDCVNPLYSPKQQAWILFYNDIRSCFGDAIPKEWIPDPKNLKALPDHVQQELIKLHGYDFYVGELSDEIVTIDTHDIVHDWNKERPGANFIVANALDLNFANLKGPYDYLQIDIDDHVNHCNLLKSVITEHEFQVITFEHDFWRQTPETADCRERSRQIMRSEGYVLLCSDITCEPDKGHGINNEPIYFEDWYVNPSQVDPAIIDVYKCVSEYPRPLHYTDVLFTTK